MSTSGNQRVATKVDRKRITDRKAQRNHRERVKAYISHLETTVEELTKASQEGSECSLLQKLQEKQLEIERLKGAIRQANTALRTALDTTSASITRSIAEIVPRDTPVTENNSPSVAEHETTQRLNNRRIQMEYTLELEDISPNMSRASQFQNNNKRKDFAAPYSNLACGDGQMNYFQVLNESLIHVLSGGPLTTSAADDDDLTIRAILHGWDTIKEEKPLDRGWNFLRALDQGLFYRTGPVERLAILRLMRSMLMSKNGSPGHSTGQIPSFMFPTPNLRDHLIASETSHTSEAAAAHYAAEIQLSWPYQVRDAYRYHEEEGKFQFSIEFNNTYYDLKSWKFRSNPALKMLVANGPTSLLEGRLQASSSILINSLDPNGIIESGGVVGY
ncbi:hypothetical protein BDV33DRAFT_195215 [Aspergillus novoparasiticus]|uniref:BZIP domain-containing protein n=1 Tax=Aspergillus novoparasiticus TaxID=986946 RepID=A0A5N6EEK2_9EURO|nr:hypothetical protein BDV33DRAFT_195215 [Aspergillus novoparasiticus]